MLKCLVSSLILGLMGLSLVFVACDKQPASNVTTPSPVETATKEEPLGKDSTTDTAHKETSTDATTDQKPPIPVPEKPVTPTEFPPSPQEYLRNLKQQGL